MFIFLILNVYSILLYWLNFFKRGKSYTCIRALHGLHNNRKLTKERDKNYQFFFFLYVHILNFIIQIVTFHSKSERQSNTVTLRITFYPILNLVRQKVQIRLSHSTTLCYTWLCKYISLIAISINLYIKRSSMMNFNFYLKKSHFSIVNIIF